ncbi:MAG TPA: DUF4233 domain-containing protein [Amnibacterium sp.]|uniref:DUF4233 domain-containing protein n=1 Tax=Amnibacterium sp. TaxID=1872496 RepID=UPI002F95A3B4
MSTPRVRRPRTLTASLAAIVLATEFLVVVLAALVVFGLKSLPAPVALGGGAALLVVMAIAAALSRSRVGIALGWLVQLVLIAAFVVQPAVGVVGLFFGALWTYCMIIGGRIDRRTTNQSERTAP